MKLRTLIVAVGTTSLMLASGCAGDESSNVGGTTSVGGSGGGGTGGSGGTGGTGGTAGSGGTSSGGGGTGGTACTPPDEPTGPLPADGATDISPDTVTAVSWDASAGATGYDVYLSDVCPPPAYPDAAFQHVSTTTLDNLALDYLTSYCWQVVAVGSDPDCTTAGPVWGFDTGCTDLVPGEPTVTSGDATYPSGTTSGTYTLTFSEDVLDVSNNLVWTAVAGIGTMDAVNQIDGLTYEITFSGVADGDSYTLSVGTGVTDGCQNALAAQVDINIGVLIPGYDCGDAVDVTNATFPFQLTGTYDDDPLEGGSCDTTHTNAVWYTYTAPSTGYFDISAVNNTTTAAYSRLAIFEGSTCSPLGTELDCVTATATSASTAVPLTGGTTYLIQFHTDGDTYTMVDPELTITPVPPLPGDSCSSAVDISTATFPFQLIGDYSLETDPGGSCDTTPTNIVWYSYTPTATGDYDITAVNNTTTLAYSRLAVWETAACNPHGTELVCDTASSSTITSTVTLTAGTTYLIAFHTDGDSYTMIDPEITIAPATALPGDSCSSAVDISTATFPYQLIGTYGLEADPGGSCDTAPTNIVWYSYTPTATDSYDITAVNNTTTLAYSRLAVWETAACNPHGTELDCVTAGSSTITGTVTLTAGTTYLIAFYTDGDGYTMVDPEITIAPTPPPPEGDTCTAPATSASPNYYFGPNGEDCWSWTATPNNTLNDHTFACDTGVGGDVVVEYTTGNGQTTLSFDGTIANYESGGYIRLEITDSPCASGASDYCTANSGQQNDTGSITVTPNTTYYLWVTDGFSGHYLPDIDLCLNP